MDERELLAEILKSSNRTNELLEKQLARRFSLFALFVVMTAICIVFGIGVFLANPMRKFTPPSASSPLISSNPPARRIYAPPPADAQTELRKAPITDGENTH